ncbi:MAG: YggS family pyridoxal phosphate-dependent enzyme [Candidatus Eisenbacteria bacterium]|uniref:Pyridoxal phosphate homeostasis protein n=1 Tax=Eiseniibacteriota bacterium TaxID=2212470 RepID=A0A849SE00_UNCEI|nr:YggS family pyridoxal phosphate-dependent enzyme [Candidatus Eisenbacteria bacterium]
MNGSGSEIRERLAEIRARIAASAARSGRPASAVTLIGASKQVAPEQLSEALAAGLGDLGENRVQEALAKFELLGRVGIQWHLIGPLQRNKIGRALAVFDRLHGVDDLELARAIATRAEAAGRRIAVLIEVNVSGEAGKHGVAPAELESVLEQAAGWPALALDGLMTLARPVERAEDARRDFVRLRELRDRSEERLGIALPQLSMGMSGDFEVAIEEGATMVRIGTALFGGRRIDGAANSG